jgi:fructokinase
VITVIGEALVHLTQTSDASRLRARPGGSALNIAVATARLGHPVALLARLSSDLYGQKLHQYAVQNGVDVSGATDADEPTAIAIDVTGTVPGAPPVPGTRVRLYSGDASARHWTPADLSGLPAETSVLHLGSLVWQDAQSATRVLRTATRLRQRGALAWMDLRVYPEMMKGPAQSRILLERPLRSADIVYTGAYDIGWLYPGRPREAVAEHWLGLGPTMVIVGSRSGYMVVRQSGSVTHWPPPAPARLVDKAGKKETFTAVFLGALHALVQKGQDVTAMPPPVLAHLLGMATLAAGITCERSGADPPTAAELEERISRQPSRAELPFMKR